MTAPDDVRAKLLPCPFCGHSMESDDEDGCYQKAGFIGPRTPVWSVTCFGTACNASVEATSKDAAIAAWNRRAAHADMAGEVRELAEELIEAINDGDAQSARNAALAALAKYTNQEPQA